MNWSIAFSPLLPDPAVLALGIVGLILVAGGAFARARGTFLRFLTLAALFLALLNPSVREEQREPLTDVAVVVVDRSQSQEMGKRMPLVEGAEAHIRKELANLPETEFRIAPVTSGVEAGEDGTRLFSAWKRAAADVPPDRYAGTILITDGQIHDVPQTKAELGYDGPMHALITGRTNERDRLLIVEQAPRFAIVGQLQTLRVKVEETGTNTTRGDVTLSLSVDGGPRRDFDARTGESIDIPVTIEHGGKNVIELSVEPLPGEITEQNNRAALVVEGIRDRLRVLLVSGHPHPGERTWRNLLKADASVDLVHFTILRPPEKQDGTPIRELSLIAFPTRELFVEKLNEFDLIIFDRYQRRGVLPLAYLANITEYVMNGGAVLVAAGPDYATPLSLYSTPLAEVLPGIPTGEVTSEPFRAQISEMGRRHPVTRPLADGHTGEDGAPTWGRWFRLVDADVRDGTTLMEGPKGKPLMVLSRREKGRVAELMSDHAWLWARGFDGGGPQAEMLRRMAHWLMKEPELEEEALSGRQQQRQIVIERRTMADKAAPVTMTEPSGETRQIELSQAEPGVFTARVDVKEAGIHRLDDGTLKAVVAVGSADPKETSEIHATDAKIKDLIGQTQGAVTWVGSEGDRLTLPRIVKVKPGRAMAGSGWLGLKANGAYTVRAIEEVPLFGTLLSLALLLGLAGLMWYREGR
ncbi:MAG: hypothetical protein AB7S41_06245 [Parvibaculaceae bacterium]